mmetsp:Transcript_325/g.421  ORF Transcript_325/g.421 Transcript_325/m.421 type:complete len:90 (-) Transcript_325:239-508(-)
MVLGTCLFWVEASGEEYNSQKEIATQHLKPNSQGSQNLLFSTTKGVHYHADTGEETPPKKVEVAISNAFVESSLPIYQLFLQELKTVIH